MKTFGKGIETTNGIESAWKQLKMYCSFYRGIKNKTELNYSETVQEHGF